MRLNELHPEERILVLGWMRESIESGIKNVVLVKSYWMFCEGIKQDQPFDPDAVWNLFRPHQQAHFQRTAAALDLLDEQIEDAQKQADQHDDTISKIAAEVEGGPDDG